MADEQGIHPEVVRQLTDLHRKHAELQMQMHDKGSEEPHEIFQQMLTELKTLNEHLSQLIPAVEADTKADLGEARSDKNERGRGRKPNGGKNNGGESPPQT